MFRDVAADAGLHAPLKGMMAHAAAWGDVDRDGDLDLFVGSFADRPDEIYRAGGANGPVPNVLLIQRDGRFVPAENKSIAWKGRAAGAVLADLNNDGWPDLYVSNNGRLGKENLLYRNNHGQLELVVPDSQSPAPLRAGAPLHLPETSRGVGVFDFDGDGLLDLLVLATLGKGPSMLFQNQGDFRFKLSKALPADLVGLGVAIGDVTGNGWPDVFVGGANRLFVGRGRGRFREATELGLDWGFPSESDVPSCGAAFGDFDRDGRMDLLIGAHTKRPWADPVPLRLFRNLGSTPEAVRFREVTEQVGLRPLPMKTPHVEIRDFDNDGWPDLYTAVAVYLQYAESKVYPAIYKNLGDKAHGPRSVGFPKFQETAFVHRPNYPQKEDYQPGMRTAEFYDQLVAGRKLMYFAPGPSSDFDGDGRLDLMLASWFATAPSLLLKNETPAGRYLDVAVVGADGVNRDGIGSIVRAYRPGEAGHRPQVGPAGADFVASEAIATGYGYSSGQEPVAHLGLGELKRCDVVVTLPHGKGQIVLRNVETNRRLHVDASEAARKKSAAFIDWPPKVKTAAGQISSSPQTIRTDCFLNVPPPVAQAHGLRPVGFEGAAHRFWPVRVRGNRNPGPGT